MTVLLFLACAWTDSTDFDDAMATCDEPGACELPADQVAAPAPHLWYTCGDPVCRGYTGTSGLPRCGPWVEGDRCPPRAIGRQCDPGDACNRYLECRRDRSPGPCPISRAAHKKDIRYLDPTERAAVASRLLTFPLANWRYLSEPGTAPLHTGFLIDDVEGTPAVAADGEHVDLYGYTSMTVAAIQEQAARLDAQSRELEALRAELAALRKQIEAR